MPTATETRDAKQFLADVENDLRSRWSRLAKQKFSQNKKGQGFEVAALQFFENYLGRNLEFHNRVALLDRKLTLFRQLSKGSNEWDLVATFATSIPRLVLHVESLDYVPLDGAFFVAEVKKSLTSTSLEADLGKLAPLRELVTKNRFGNRVPAPFEETELLRLLLYYKREIRSKRLWEILGSRLDTWDMLLVLEDRMLFVNKRIRAAAEIAPGPEKISYAPEFPITQLLNFLTFALPTPAKIITISPWNNLMRQAQGMDPT